MAGGFATDQAIGGAATGAAAGSIAGPIGTAVGGVVGAVGGIFGGKGGGGEVQESGLTLPYEYEKRLMDTTDANLAEVKKDLQRLDTMTKTYMAKVSAAEKYQKGLIGDADYAKQIGAANQRIAMAFGGDVESAIKSGYLTEDSKADLQALKDLESEDFADPTLERQIKDQRKQLEQDLKRSGASPAAKALALQQFNQSADEQRFTRSDELRNAKYQRMTGTIQTGAALQQQGFNQAVTGAQFVQQQGQNLQSGMQQLLGYGQAGYEAQAAQLAGRAGYRQEEAQTFSNLGQYKLSPRATEYSANKAAGGVKTEGQKTLNPYIQQEVDKLGLTKLSDSDLVAQLQRLSGFASAPNNGRVMQAGYDAVLREQERRLYTKK